ncbi:MAG: hypothetical protein KJO82_11175 [Gammaproteobacteria bacterium]|nr:hypothetical protein [Gammaproteobacteria bacterium]
MKIPLVGRSRVHTLILPVVLALGLAACGSGIDSYEDAVDAQAEVMEQMIHVLENVEDQATADAAVDDIEKLGEDLAAIMQEMRKLPEPTMDELMEIGQKQGAKMIEFQERAMPQLMKLAKYPNLSEAWMRAMQNMG